MANIPELLNDKNKWGDFTAALVLLGVHPKNTVARGRVVVTDDPRRRHDLVWIFKMQTRIADLWKGAPAGASADRAEAGRLMTLKYLPQSAKVGRIPSSLTGGVETYLWDVIIPIGRLPDGGATKKYRETYLVPCRLGRRGQGGTEMEVLPYTRAMRARRTEQFVEAVRRRGAIRVRAAVVQANNGLWRTGDVTLPATVLFTFDRGIPNEAEYLADLARRASRIKNGGKPTNPNHRLIHDRLWAGERAECDYHDRVRLPRGFTGGPVIFMGGLWMPPAYLRGGMIQKSDPLYVLAEPGEVGGAELLPYRDTEPDGEEKILAGEPAEEVDVLPEVDEDEEELPEV